MLPETSPLSRGIVPPPSTALPSLIPLQVLRQPTTSRIPSAAPFLAATPSNDAVASEFDPSHKCPGAPSAAGQTVRPTSATAQLQTRRVVGRPPARTDLGCCAFSLSLVPSVEPSAELPPPAMPSVNWTKTARASVARSRMRLPVRQRFLPAASAQHEFP